MADDFYTGLYDAYADQIPMYDDPYAFTQGPVESASFSPSGTGTPVDSSGPLGLNTNQWLSLLAGLGPTALGAAGIAQQLGRDSNTSTQTRTSAIDPAYSSLLQSLLGQGQGMLSNTAATGVQNAVGPLLEQVPGMGSAQRSLLGQVSSAASGFDEGPNRQASLEWAARNFPNYFPGGASHPSAQSQFDSLPAYLRTDSLQNNTPPPSYQSKMRDSVGGLVPQAMLEIPGMFGAQKAALDPSRQFAMDPAIMDALGANALGLARGELPTLNAGLKSQVGDVYRGLMTDVDRYADEGLLDALERARARGFHGGTEVFREGMPGALVDRTMAEAVRQRGALAGAQAKDELSLALSLPGLAGSAALNQANIGFSGNTSNRALADSYGSAISGRLGLPTLASNLETQRIGNQATRVNALSNAAGTYNTPMSIPLSAGTNLANLNQNLLSSLLSGGAGAAGLTGSVSGQTSTPTSLLDAFAPTSSLLGGVGGLLTGIGAANGTYNPNATRRPY